MKKQIADQVAFFLMGLQGRFEENDERYSLCLCMVETDKEIYANHKYPKNKP